MNHKIALSTLLLITFSFLHGQTFKNIKDVQGKPAGVYTFNFGKGDFKAYVDKDGWMLWLQYHHKGGTNPALNIIKSGNDLPKYDGSRLGKDNSKDLSKWGHGSQAFAASIPDKNLWLRWEGVTSNHKRKIHFESPVLGKFQSNDNDSFGPKIISDHVLRKDHTANLPQKASGSSSGSKGDFTLVGGSFIKFNEYAWEIRSGKSRWNVDDVKNSNGKGINYEHNTIHRVWVKTIPFTNKDFSSTLDKLKNHINGTKTVSKDKLNQFNINISSNVNRLSESKSMILKAKEIINAYENIKGPLFSTKTTKGGFLKDPLLAPNLELERVMIKLQQGVFDFVFTPEVYAKYPEVIDGFKYKTSASFPGDVAPPADANKSYTIPIRANFEDPKGINPYYGINSEGTDHALRPTGMYLAPGSVATITVPKNLVGKDFYIRVGSHEWDFTSRRFFKRLDRISKKFLITGTSMKVFNPMGGAISILVPYKTKEGIKEIGIKNAVQAPFFSLKTFHKTKNFDAELEKPAPWAVFETDNIMFTVPKHALVKGKYDLKQSLLDWDKFLQAINEVLYRQTIPDKHDVYVMLDLDQRASVYSLGYPMINTPIKYDDIPGHPNFFDGPKSKKYAAYFHEYGHASRISKFKGEREAVVNFLYAIGMNRGLDETLSESLRLSFYSGQTIGLEEAAIHRMVSNTFGSERDISNKGTDEVKYQIRGYAHYAEMVNLFGWCSLKNFFKKEFIDFENGIDHGINNQNTDSRIIRMSIAAHADLRPLFHVFGILPTNAKAVQDSLTKNKIPASLAIYNRLQEYLKLIPKDKNAFKAFALKVHPKLEEKGPKGNKENGEGWFYQKTLSYNEDEAKEIASKLKGIIGKYYPNGTPKETTIDLCAKFNNVLSIGIRNEGDDVTIFPNPTSQKLNVIVRRGNANITALKLYSTTGQLVHSYKKVETTIDLSPLDQGVYILKIYLDNGDEISKRVVVKR